MARFGSSLRSDKGERSPITVNLAGGKAYSQDAKHELVSIVLTSLVKDQFYRSSEDTLAQLRSLLDNVDPVFAAKAAIYARRVFHMRSITHILAAEVVARTRGPEQPNAVRDKNGMPVPPEPSWIPSFIEKVVSRPDDISEIAAYYMEYYGPMPTRLKRGLAAALRNVDDYGMAKYNGSNRLLNVVRLVHPRPTETITKLIYGTLPAPDTWEVKVTQAGQVADEDKAQAKTEAWDALVVSGTMGHMALLRNLRNIAQHALGSLDLALAQVSDPEKVKKGKQFPVRYMTAANEIINSDGITEPVKRKVANALEVALEASVSNVPVLEGKTVVFVDNSGSMHGYSTAGSASYSDIAAIFGAAMAKRNDADIIVFSDTARYVHYNAQNTTLQIAASIQADIVPAGTYLGSAVGAMVDRYDRIIIFSDMQTWIEGNNYYGYGRGGESHIKLLAEYEKQFDVKPYIYSVDLTGYGTTNWEKGRIIQIAGLSDKIFDLISLAEQDREALVHEIEKIAI